MVMNERVEDMKKVKDTDVFTGVYIDFISKNDHLYQISLHGSTGKLVKKMRFINNPPSLKEAIKHEEFFLTSKIAFEKACGEEMKRMKGWQCLYGEKDVQKLHEKFVPNLGNCINDCHLSPKKKIIKYFSQGIKEIDLYNATNLALIDIPGIDDSTALKIVRIRKGADSFDKFSNKVKGFDILTKDIQFDVGLLAQKKLVLYYNKKKIVKEDIERLAKNQSTQSSIKFKTRVIPAKDKYEKKTMRMLPVLNSQPVRKEKNESNLTINNSLDRHNDKYNVTEKNEGSLLVTESPKVNSSLSIPGLESEKEETHKENSEHNALLR